ncbi:MAG: hypothetical protein IH788_06060, partial [Nitrospinae bacterium]|nr:hypothetical protein [Nitrospinota bacterium]
KVPEAEGRIFIVVDPMVATGDSAAAAVDLLNQNGVADDAIRFMALVAAPEGVGVFHNPREVEAPTPLGVFTHGEEGASRASEYRPQLKLRRQAFPGCGQGEGFALKLTHSQLTAEAEALVPYGDNGVGALSKRQQRRSRMPGLRDPWAPGALTLA